MFLFIIFFVYFYFFIVFNFKDIVDNLRCNGGYVLGFRFGEGILLFLNFVVSKFILWGLLYLAFIFIVFWILVKVMGVFFYFGGMVVLIVV